MTSYNITVNVASNSYKFKGAEGAKVYNQLLHGMDVHAIGLPEGASSDDATESVIIPFHAVIWANYEMTVTEDPEVEDAVCNETNT